MALLGTLKGFGVTEIFQLISQQMKTGALILSSPKANVTITFENGIIVGITSDQWERDPRADVLLKADYVNDKELKAAFESEKKNSERWHEILISKGQLKKIFLDRATTVVIKQILLEVFQWREGGYKFDDWNTESESMLSCHISTEGAILDTLRIIDEWPTIKQKIPPVDYCPVTIIPITEEIVRHHDLSDVDMHIYDLIDEKRTVERIVKESLEPPFEALSSIVRLLDIGLVEVFPEGARDIRDVAIARNLFLSKIKQVALYVVLVLSIFTLIIIGQPRITKGIIPNEIKTYLNDQKTVLQRFSGKQTALSMTDTNNYGH
ncbi:MAG: DUF4388 domain-containing protein [Desulfomonilia bacterium]